MSKFDSWVMDQQEREMEEAADRLKKEEGLKTFKVTERYIKQDTWIVNAINKEEATDIAMSVDPDTSEVVRVECTIAEPLEEVMSDIFDSRDLLDELKTLDKEDDEERIKAIEELIEEVGEDNFEAMGVTFIRENYWVQYCEDMAYDFGYLDGRDDNNPIHYAHRLARLGRRS